MLKYQMIRNSKAILIPPCGLVYQEATEDLIPYTKRIVTRLQFKWECLIVLLLLRLWGTQDEPNLIEGLTSKNRRL